MVLEDNSRRSVQVRKLKILGKTRPRFNVNKSPLIVKLATIFVISCYLIYLMLIIMTRMPYLAENFTDRSIPDDVSYHLTFFEDGLQTHYNVTRSDKSKPGQIDIYYYPKINKLNINLQNIRKLIIDCRSMYSDECLDVFGFDPYINENSNFYKWYFIEKNHLKIQISLDSDLALINLKDVPKPEIVLVNNQEWLESTDYQYNSETGIAISELTKGSHEIDIYFKSSKDSGKVPKAKINASKKVLLVNEELKLDGSGSTISDPDASINNYIWDFGDGNFSSGIERNKVTWKYPNAGFYGIILTVVSNDFQLGFTYLNVTVLEPSGFSINGRVPDIELSEDSATFELNLHHFEPSFEMIDRYTWYFTGIDESLVTITGENSTDDTIQITPKPNQFGSDEVILWLEDQYGNKTWQWLWINITPVNDPPVIFGIPDITIHFDVPYEFNYLPYITDIDTPHSELKLNSSEQEYTTIEGLNVTYEYPKNMLDEIVYVVLSICDGEFVSSDVVAVWITDDWVPNLINPLPDVYLKEGEVIKNYFDLDDYFMDPDNDTLYYSYGYTHVNVVINPNHTVDFYAPKDWFGEEMTTFRATDPSGALIEDIITVIVFGVNDPPVIKNIPNLIVRYDQPYAFDVSPYISDVDNPLEDLRLTTSQPDYIKINLHENNHLTLILNYPYREDIPYTDTVTITVSDAIDTDFQIITVFVKDNYPPILLKQFPKVTMFEDVGQYNEFNLNDYFYDNDSTVIYFSAINQNNIATDIHLNGSIDIIPKYNWYGEETITIRAQDEENSFEESKLYVKVLPVNDPPIISEIPVQTFNSTEKYILDLKPFIHDIDNNVTQLKIWLEDCDIDHEIHGAKIIFYAVKPSTTTATLHISDGPNDAEQKVLLEIKSTDQNPQKTYLELLLIFVILTMIMIVGISIAFVRKYYGDFEVNELFLIHKNGCLILHESNEDYERDDADVDIISAMFTAVQDFTRDSFSNKDKFGDGVQDDENWKLKKLEFKNNNIILERGELLYLAVVFSGKLGKKLTKDLRQLRLEIEDKYQDVLNNWDGDLEPLDGVHDMIENHKIIPKLKRNPINLESIKKQLNHLHIRNNTSSGNLPLDCKPPNE